jgi:hypothetical protein
MASQYGSGKKKSKKKSVYKQVKTTKKPVIEKSKKTRKLDIFD